MTDPRDRRGAGSCRRAGGAGTAARAGCRSKVARLTPDKRRGGVGAVTLNAQGLRRIDAGVDGHRGWSLSKGNSSNRDAELSHRVLGSGKEERLEASAAQHPAFEHGPRHAARREYSPPNLAFDHLPEARIGSRLASSSSSMSPQNPHAIGPRGLPGPSRTVHSDTILLISHPLPARFRLLVGGVAFHPHRFPHRLKAQKPPRP